MKYLLSTTFLILSATTVPLSSAPGSDLEITAAVTNSLPRADGPREAVPVSNIEKIEFELIFDVRNTLHLSLFEDLSRDFSPSGKFSNLLSITARDELTEKVIPVDVTIILKKVVDQKKVVKFGLLIRQTDEVRADKISKFIQNEIEKQEVAFEEGGPDLALQLKTKKTAVAAALERIFAENRLGLFSLVAEFQSDDASTWKGKLDTRPVRVEVLDKGSFLNSLSKDSTE